jgi:ATP-binding cassette subfamily B protein
VALLFIGVAVAQQGMRVLATYCSERVAFKRAAALLPGVPPACLVEHHPLPLRSPVPNLLSDQRPKTKDRSGQSFGRSSLVLGPSSRERLEALEVAGLTLRHPESGRGVEDITFTLRRGSFTVITGRIGAGKTTLLRALLGLIEPQAGAVSWNGRKIEHPDRFMTPPRVAYTPQTPALLSGTLRENILLGLPDDERLQRAVRAAVLERDLAAFPDGLATLIGARGMRLSC